MGTVTIANLKKRVEGGRRRVGLDLTLSSSYATNGDSIAAADQQAILADLNIAALSAVELVLAPPGSDGTTIYLDGTNNKVKAFSGRTEVTAAVNLSVTPGVMHIELVAPAVTG